MKIRLDLSKQFKKILTLPENTSIIVKTKHNLIFDNKNILTKYNVFMTNNTMLWRETINISIKIY